MEAIRNSVAEVKTLVLGTGPSHSSSEPPSGIEGPGTVDQPYDQGNAPEATTKPAAADPSTETKPTQEESAAAATTNGAATTPATKVPSNKPGTPYDIIGHRRQSTKPQSGAVTPQPPTEPASKPQDEPATTTPSIAVAGSTESAGGDTKEAAKPNDDRGRSLKVPGSRGEYRDVSPGTLDDGSHAVTSGDRGESYDPGTLNKLKGKFHIGRR